MPLAVLKPGRADSGRGASREQTRRRLLAMGRRAFARKGLAATHLKDDILGPANVSVGSFYHQFHDKTELFLAILREHSETFRARVRAANTASRSGAADAVARQSFTTVFDVADANDDLFRIMARELESHEPRVRQYLQENHRAWIGSLAEDYHRLGVVPSTEGGKAELIAELISALTFGAVLRYLDLSPPERRRQRSRLIDGLVAFTLGGITSVVAQRLPHKALRPRKGG